MQQRFEISGLNRRGETHMNVLVVGSGGREHALCWQFAASPLLGALWCAPGNAGIANEATCVALDPMDFDGLVSFCREQAIDFVVVGPEAPLCAGLVDRLEAEGIAAFGPRKDAARIEGSKGFMKDLCARHGVPTAAYRRIASLAEAEAFIAEQGAPVVVKADGLAGGKGVVLAQTADEALDAARAALDGAFGEAGAELVIEEMMVGEEASYFALVDGETVLPLEAAQDHKAVGEGDTGPNTGGMGAFSPAPVMTPALCEEARTRIVEPLVQGMAEDGTPYTGVFYAGLMLTANGPKLLEVNARFGDPECQVLVPRLKSDLLAALMAAHVPSGRRAQGLRPALARRGRALRRARDEGLSRRLREGQHDQGHRRGRGLGRRHRVSCRDGTQRLRHRRVRRACARRDGTRCERRRGPTPGL